jgi:hypothetical protein
MAVTAEDQKYLSQAGIAAVQKATDDWNKANAAGDTAGMAAAAAAAASARGSSTYQASGGAGYTTDSWGRYVAPITPITPTSSGGGSSGGGTVTVSDPYAGRDIAAEIISLLTGGGAIDYGQLNSLAQQRDAKMASNPNAYGQFESTQAILDRYLPLAQQNESLTKQLQGVQQRGVQQQPSEVDTIIDLLTQLGQSSIPRMSFAEAQQRAGSELNPMYEDAAMKLMQGLNADMEQRGIYNSPLASGIMTEKQGQLSNEQIQAIAQRANTLIQNDAEMSLQEKQLRSSTLGNLLSSLIGRETNLANITGTYQGQPTFANQQFQTETALREGELTGTYNGTQTLAGRAFDLQASTQALNNALNTVENLGQVTTQAQADLLGVPIGTPSWQARNAAEQRQQELYMFNQEMGLKRQSNALAAQANAASKLLADFNKDMIIWETTGKAPDTEAMRHYGIAPGTPFSGEAARSVSEKLQETQDQINLIGAEEELQFQNRATNFMKSYGVTRGVAEAALLIVDQSADYETASAMVKNQKTALQNEGINITNLETALKKYFDTSSTYGGTSAKVDATSGAAPTASAALASSYNLLSVDEGVPPILEAKFPNARENYPYYNSDMMAYYAKIGGQWYYLDPK